MFAIINIHVCDEHKIWHNLYKKKYFFFSQKRRRSQFEDLDDQDIRSDDDSGFLVWNFFTCKKLLCYTQLYGLFPLINGKSERLLLLSSISHIFFLSDNFLQLFLMKILIKWFFTNNFPLSR